LSITQDVTIDGSGLTPQITISGDSDQNGAGDVRVFVVTLGATATLDSLTITKGSASLGGGIYNDLGSALTINNSTISGNEATSGHGGGIKNDGILIVTNSTFSNNSVTGGSTTSGGGIANIGTLTVTNSTFSGNTTNGSGGGIFNDTGTTLTVTNSTFSGNQATGGPGGGIRNDGTLTITNSTFSTNTATASGGGIRNIGALTVTNSTFSGNSAGGTGSGGGIYNVLGFTSVMITNSTFSGNQAASQGGGIYFSGGTLNYANTIIANSITAGNPGGDCAGNGTIGTNTKNLVEDSGCSATLSGNPGLDSLADNSGSTQTFALISGSKAIDAGDDATCTASPVSGLDQRGVARPVGACDIGAYEGSIPDTVAPSVDSFTATSPSTSLNIPITAFTASDNANVSGYLITISAAPPSTGDSGWTGLAPSTYTVGSLDNYNLYAWAKDAAGYVSSGYGPVSVTVCYSSVTVTSSADSGPGTLRQAISDGCSAGSTINFDSTLSGAAIYLSSPLTLSKNITIDGSALAAQITISGDSDHDNTGDVQVFSVSSGVTATLDSLMITKGSTSTSIGGGIYNGSGAVLTITNSTLSGNMTGGPGGGIKNDGTLTVTNSTFSDNSAGLSGGGIRNAGTLTVTNSTFSGNIAASGSGGGIYVFSGTATVTNSTFSANQAASAGGGIYYAGTLNYANTIIANSSGGDCAGSGTLGTNTNNLVEDGSCSSGGTNFLSLDPNLGPLADNVPTGYNGGPTQTFALLTGSPAIDAGDNTVCDDDPGPNNLDQRGVDRPQGAYCDIGAYEYQHQSTVTKLADTDDNICDSSDCSLREAIATAGYRQTITFASSLSGGTIHLGSTLDINQYMTIDGSALASKITVSGDGSVRVFFILSNTNVTLDSLIITGGNGTALSSEGYTGGGGIQNNSGNLVGRALTVKNSIVSGNSADDGGGIFNRDGSILTIINSTISGNTASGNGGGIYTDGNLLEISDSTISGNSSGASNINGDQGGGGVRNNNVMTLTNSTIFGNTATASGGGIQNNGNLTVKNSTFSGNSASLNGGGLRNTNALAFANSIIANSLSGGDCNGGDVNINTNNLVEDGGCSSNGTNFLSGVDPNLDVLADNGGPTQTMALILGSPAIDAGDDTTCTNAPVSNLDQRGVTRLSGAHCDIGAFELDTDAPTVHSFTATSPSSSLAIPITAFTASDNVAVSGYMITETSTPPTAGAAGWTVSAPSTYTVVGEGLHTLYPWAKDAAGNVSAVVGSPASVTVDTTAPTVLSSTLVSASPTTLTSVQFTVTFSESVTGVDTSDFSLTETGVTGGSVTGVSGSGAIRTVTVNTGSGNGTIRLNVLDDNTILDAANNPLNGAFSSGQTYTIAKTVTLTFTSTSTQDGWILESSETSAVGGTLNGTSATFNLGDDKTKKQYRGILSFNTRPLPDTAVITGVTLKVKKQAIVGGGNPLTIFQGFMVDIKKGFFGTSALQTTDFQTLTGVKTYGPFSPALSSNWYSINLTSAKAYINKLSSNGGLTQIRLRFKLDDNNNAVANYLSLYSGNTTTAANRPQLVITYTP
jgi:CSLREA domain-containing protein